jgi:esterase/lipase superfamily enzyme
VAHSIGNLLTVEGIRQAKLLGQFSKKGRLAAVILASPDIDVDLFEQQIAVFPENERNFFILISRDDKAIAVSRKIAGRIDRVSDRSSLNHTKFAVSPEMVKLIGRRVNAGDQFGTEGAGVSSERISAAGAEPESREQPGAGLQPRHWRATGSALRETVCAVPAPPAPLCRRPACSLCLRALRLDLRLFLA